jgi:thioredoxin-related protein
MKTRLTTLFALLGALVISNFPAAAEERSSITTSNAIVVLAADADKAIADALKLARQQGKHVLVQSCANGCTWCKVLKKLLASDEKLAAKIKNDFIYIIVDTSDDPGNSFSKKYADNTNHAVIFLALNADGKRVGLKVGTEVVEGDPEHPDTTFHISPDTVMKFLNDWSPKK